MQALMQSVSKTEDFASVSRIAQSGPILYSARRDIRAAGDSRTIAIRLAESDGERNRASMVVNRQYGSRGYGNAHRLFGDSHTVVFTASSGSHIFGTITLTADSDKGLAADKTFVDELAELRSEPGTVLCELTKFAFDPSPDSRPFLASLFHIVYLYGTERFGGTDLLIEVNPRHVRFYEVMLGFKRVGALKDNDSVGAPSQLMHVKVAHIGQQIAKHAGSGDCKSRSLYPYFFNAEEEAGLKQRVRHFATDWQKSKPANATIPVQAGTGKFAQHALRPAANQ